MHDTWLSGAMWCLESKDYVRRCHHHNRCSAAAGDYDMLQEEWSHVSQEGQDLVRLLLSYKPAGRGVLLAVRKQFRAMCVMYVADTGHTFLRACCVCVWDSCA
jgi:hypothetical protein